MAILGRWTQATTTLIPTATFAAPNGLFGTQARNDGSAYTFTNSTATLTLPATDLANGYLIVARLHYTDTSNGRVSIAGRFVQTGGTGNLVCPCGMARSTGKLRLAHATRGNTLSAGATGPLPYGRSSD